MFSLAGGIAAVATSPLEVLKTRLQVNIQLITVMVLFGSVLCKSLHLLVVNFRAS